MIQLGKQLYHQEQMCPHHCHHSLNLSFTFLFSRLFWANCDRCHHSFTKTDYVMKAKNKLYHMQCFR